MSPLILLGLVGLGLFAVAVNQHDYTSDDDGDSGEGDESAEAPTDTGDSFDVDTGDDTGSGTPDEEDTGGGGAGETLTGTDGADTITLDGPAGPGIEVSAGAGNDLIDLYDGSTDPVELDAQLLDGALLSGGDGNDLIEAYSTASTITGDGGNDTISGRHDGASIDGGAGNDLVSITSSEEGAGSDIRGDVGADTISAFMDGGRVDGGAGNDLIFANPAPTTPTEIDGGEGSDHLVINAVTPPIQQWEAGVSVTGGDGADIFDLIVAPGGSDIPDTPPTAISMLADGTVQVDIGTITDFSAGEDLLLIDGATNASQFTLAAIELEETAPDGAPLSTVVRLVYEIDATDVANRDVILTLSGASGLTVDDVIVTGAGTTAVPLNFIGRDAAAA